jgi:hypothetical protein
VTVGIVFHEDLDAKPRADVAAGRFAGIAQALAEAGAEAIPVGYNDSFADRFLNEAAQVDGILVWVNPIEDGSDRSRLDDCLRLLNGRGVMVSAHPDTIIKMGTKQVLFDTRAMDWGTDVRVHHTLDGLMSDLVNRLGVEPLVLKQYRGQSGDGVWRIRLDTTRGLKLWHARRGSVEASSSWDEAAAIFARYFEGGGRILEQPFQERLAEGMIRCYCVVDRIEGFGHQAINAFHPTDEPGPRLYHPPDQPEFQRIRVLMENAWIPTLLKTVELERTSLPLIWDADFLLGPPDADGQDTFVLCEINASSVSPFPEWAQDPLARATIERIRSRK